MSGSGGCAARLNTDDWPAGFRRYVRRVPPTATVTALMIALIGCTTPSSMYVGQDGKRIRCAAHGWGYMGVTMAQGIHDQCSADAKAAGLIPLAEAGIRPGDFIIAVDDQPVTNVADGRRMFFRARKYTSEGDVQVWWHRQDGQPHQIRSYQHASRHARAQREIADRGGILRRHADTFSSTSAYSW